MPKRAMICLVVEDGELERKRLCRILGEQCNNVHPLAARCLQDARTHLMANSVDLIFLDNALPDGNGVDFAKELAGYPATRHIPIIMVSDFPTPFIYAKIKSIRDCEVWNKSDCHVLTVKAAVEKRAKLLT